MSNHRTPVQPHQEARERPRRLLRILLVKMGRGTQLVPVRVLGNPIRLVRVARP